MKASRVDFIDLLVLSLKQSFSRLPFWIRPNLWFLLLSLPILTIPAASAALHHTVSEGLQDPSERRVKAREAFRKAFFSLFGRSLVLSIINFLALALIIFTFNFWMGFDNRFLNYVSILVIYFGVMWWLCQPFIFPALIENPGLQLQKVIAIVVRLAFSQPFYALVITFIRTVFSIVGLALLGPVLLIIPVFNALFSIQAYWTMTGRRIPDLMDPVAYADLMDKKSEKI
jgi:hypothetical protein